jgi:serine/threonine-protein kinase
VEAAVAREIEAAVRDALGLYGVSGTVVVQKQRIELHGHGAPVEIDIEHLGEQWELLPQEMRARKVADVARRLVQAHRTVSSIAPPGANAPARPPTVIAIPVAAVLLVGALAFFGFRMLRSKPPPPPPPPVPTESVDDAAARRARVCDAARKRIYAGASMGAFDTEGWFAELWLATAKPAADKGGLGELVAQGKLTDKADAELAALPDGVAEVVPGWKAEDEALFPGWRAVTVRLSGRYVGAYLDPGLRPRFLSMADRMADAAGADLGALYGRCAHLDHHDLGAWFRGADPAAAATALVYAAGFFSEQPAVDRRAVTALGGASPLDALRTAGAKLDGPTLGGLVGAQGGTLTTSGAGSIALTFPIGGPTRATRASRIVARKLGVGVEGD